MTTINSGPSVRKVTTWATVGVLEDSFLDRLPSKGFGTQLPLLAFGRSKLLPSPLFQSQFRCSYTLSLYVCSFFFVLLPHENSLIRSILERFGQWPWILACIDPRWDRRTQVKKVTSYHVGVVEQSWSERPVLESKAFECVLESKQKMLNLARKLV